MKPLEIIDRVRRALPRSERLRGTVTTAVSGTAVAPAATDAAVLARISSLEEMFVQLQSLLTPVDSSGEAVSLAEASGAYALRASKPLFSTGDVAAFGSHFGEWPSGGTVTAGDGLGDYSAMTDWSQYTAAGKWLLSGRLGVELRTEITARLTRAQADALYLTAAALSPYLTKADAQNTYLTMTDAQNLYMLKNSLGAYLTRSEADGMYLPLTGGTVTGDVVHKSNVSVRGNNRRINMLNNDGAGGALEISSTGERVTLNPVGRETVNFFAREFAATTQFFLPAGARIYAEGGATLTYDKAKGAWIFNKPIISTGDVIAFSK